MKQELEIEFKNLLTREEYEKLMSHYFSSEHTGFSQTNVYFDTANFDLKKAKCALRIRVKNNSAELTLKTPFEGHHQESNLTLDWHEAKDTIDKGQFTLPSELYDFLSEEIGLSNPTVNKLAELTTLRYEKEYEGCLLVLDKSCYSNTTDYEIELESNTIESGMEMFNSILSRFSIPKRKTPNKIARAFSKGQKS